MRITLASLMVFMLLACKEDDIKSFNLDLLYGKWNIIDQSFDNKSIQAYSQIHEFVNMDTQATLWTDTIYFGNTYLEFSACDDPCIINPFDLMSDNVRTLNGHWRIDSANYTILVGSLATEHMEEDTLINEHRYNFHSLLEGQSLKIIALSESSLKLKSGYQVIELEKE
jgi:hypothetical protein